MSDTVKELVIDTYELTPVDALPDIPVRQKGVSKWTPLVEDFLKSGHALARLDFDWPEGTTNGDVEAVQQGINNYTHRNGLRVRATRRCGEIYLQLLEPDVPVITPRIRRIKAGAEQSA